MLSKNELKLLSIFFVCESTLNKKAKVQMVSFIENDASKNQLKALIGTGKICSEQDSTNIIIHEEHLKEVIKISMLLSKAKQIGKALHARYFSGIDQKCSSKSGGERRQCIKNEKRKAEYQKLGALKSEMNKCSGTNNVSKCRKMFMKSINQVQNRITKKTLQY